MKDPRLFLFVGAVLAALIVGGFLFSQKNPEKDDIPNQISAAVQDIPEDHVRRLIDGVFVPEEEQIEELYGVMIENSEDAWPLSAISEARLVFEAPVEGSIPRYLAFFDNTQDLERIGSVRSARPYFVDWAMGFGAMYTHVGGSPEALGLLKKIGAASLNEFFWGKYFWRDNRRFAPHNVYTSIENLTEGYEERGHEPVDFESWKYKFDAPQDQRPEKQVVTVPFHPASIYDATWEYDKETNKYQRWQGGEKQEDEDTSEVFASNVVVMFTEINVIDEVGRRSVKTVGDGEGLLFVDGQKFEITWKKDARDEQLKFFIEEEEVELNAGSTWVEVVPLSTEIDVETE